MDYNSILGVVLAGGQSKRFGQDKTQVQLGEKILIDYILTEIVSEFNEILIVANNDIQFLNSKKITKVEDYKKDLGPLGGVLTAMKWIKHNKKNYKWIATFPSDTPFFSKKYLHNFIKNANDQQSKLFFVKSNDKRHNIFGLWSVELLDQLEEDLIKKHERKVEDWANKVGVTTINIEIENYDPFFNINTPEDLEKANEIMKLND